MHTSRAATSSLIAGKSVAGNRGLGVFGSAVPTIGPPYALIYNDSPDPTKEYRAEIRTWPSAGVFFVNEDSSFSFIGAPDGTYSGTYRLFEDGVALSNGTSIPDATYSLSVGATDVNLIGDDASQSNASGTGAISQVHALAGASSSQVNASGSGAVLQVHSLGGANSSQANFSSVGAITGDGTLIGAPSSQANSSSTGAISQLHTLAGPSSSQNNSSSTGSITQGGAFAGALSTQSNTSSAGTVSQVHALTGSISTQENYSSSGGVTVDGPPLPPPPGGSVFVPDAAATPGGSIVLQYAYLDNGAHAESVFEADGALGGGDLLVAEGPRVLGAQPVVRFVDLGDGAFARAVYLTDGSEGTPSPADIFVPMGLQHSGRQNYRFYKAVGGGTWAEALFPWDNSAIDPADMIVPEFRSGGTLLLRYKSLGNGAFARTVILSSGNEPVPTSQDLLIPINEPYGGVQLYREFRALGDGTFAELLFDAASGP